MSIVTMRSKTPSQVRRDLSGFAARYVDDWETWLAAGKRERPRLFGEVLRRWQATRPLAMRRLRSEATHRAPFLDDLLERAVDPLRALEGVSVATIAARSAAQDRALARLWTIFLRLPTSRAASCVGITKAVLLLTDGRVGPALDSQVRMALGVDRPTTSRKWIRILEDVGEDIAAFEAAHGALAKHVPKRFAHIRCGRLYDMVAGPR